MVAIDGRTTFSGSVQLGEADLSPDEALERRPIAERNTQFAQTVADGIGRCRVPDEISAETPNGAEALARAYRTISVSQSPCRSAPRGTL